MNIYYERTYLYIIFTLAMIAALNFYKDVV